MMCPSPAGVQAATRWEHIPQRFAGVMLDMFIIMPDHLHGILFIRTDPTAPTSPTAGEVVRWFKSALYADYSKGVRTAGWALYDGKLWQRDYYDHIIRNDHDLDHVRDYIDANPARWQERATS